MHTAPRLTNLFWKEKANLPARKAPTTLNASPSPVSVSNALKDSLRGLDSALLNLPVPSPSLFNSVMNRQQKDGESENAIGPQAKLSGPEWGGLAQRR